GLSEADAGVPVHRVAVSFVKYALHGTADQFLDAVAKLLGAEGVHGHDGSGLVHHEIHDRIVLEDSLPLLFALAQRSLRPLLLGQIKDESDALVSAFFEDRPANQHGHTATIFTEILFLERMCRSGPIQLFKSLFVSLAQFRRCQVRPADAAREEVLTIVSNHAEKRVICVIDLAIQIPDDDTDDVGVDQTPN